MKQIWLAAAENGAFPGGKVGGVGDVIHELPLALAGIGLQASVITPSYGVFHNLPGATLFCEITVRFCSKDWLAKVYRVPVSGSPVEHFVIEHPLFSPLGPGQIYVSDENGGPFEIDAAKFAFFNAALVALVNASKTPPDVLHLHDWHTGLIPALRDFGDEDAALSKVRLVFTIHNLAYQGVRPLQGHASSLASWFPHLMENAGVLTDPAYNDCVNFMVSAVRLADAVNTVSPGYAMEIQRASDAVTGFSGGEGLELELQKIHQKGQLKGVLNGCMYPDQMKPTTDWVDIQRLIGEHAELINASVSAAEWLEHNKSQRPETILLSIGRVVDQKVPLFLQPVGDYATALEAILAQIGPEGLFIMLGNGETALEQQFVNIARSNDNFLFLRGYADALSAPLYAGADLFLMPSSFEPCGISQMLAMREGQPCVVHAVGGLKDTVEHLVTGFVFAGNTPAEQAENFVDTTRSAVALKLKKPSQWQTICTNAADQRFSWKVAANTYDRELYQHA